MQPIDFNGLDTTVHGPLRLGVLTALQLDGPHDFTALKKRLGAGRWQPGTATPEAGRSRIRQVREVLRRPSPEDDLPSDQEGKIGPRRLSGHPSAALGGDGAYLRSGLNALGGSASCTTLRRADWTRAGPTGTMAVTTPA